METSTENKSKKELVPINEKTVLQQYSAENGLDDLIHSVKCVVESFEHDMSTGASRARTASLSANVSSFKVRVDGMGKDLTAEWAKKKKAVDVNRKAVRDELDKIRDIARKPLTDWEEEQSRIEAAKKAEEEAKALELKINGDHEMAILMNNEHDRNLAERARIKEDERIAEEAESKRLQEERDREIARKAKEQAELEKLQAEQREAAALAQVEAQKKAAEEAKIEAERLAKENAERIARESAEAAKKAEQDAIKRAEEAAANERARIERETAEAKAKADKLAANKAHRKKINTGALLDLVKFGMDKGYAAALIESIAKGEISHITINY